MTDEADLEIGEFYWVLPVLDPDTNEAWERDDQPARFAGRREDGTLLWHCLNVEADGPSDWPMRWIGPKIERPR
jgi:hypothetical protein